MVAGTDNPHIRSYLGSRKIAYETVTEYNEDEVIIEVLDHSYPGNYDKKKIIIMTLTTPPASTTWMLVDEKERKVIEKDRVVYLSMIVVPGKTKREWDRIRYKFKRRHMTLDVRMN